MKTNISRLWFGCLAVCLVTVIMTQETGPLAGPLEARAEIEITR